VHGIDARGNVVLRKQLRRGQIEKFFAGLAPVIVGMEACGGAHHWGRVLGKLGHEVRMMPAAYVKAYRKRNKTDGRDAEAICDAMDRPTMRFVPVKSPESHAIAVLHSIRRLLVRQRTIPILMIFPPPARSISTRRFPCRRYSAVGNSRSSAATIGIKFRCWPYAKLLRD
jgi:transposase